MSGWVLNWEEGMYSFVMAQMKFHALFVMAHMKFHALFVMVQMKFHALIVMAQMKFHALFVMPLPPCFGGGGASPGSTP